MITEEQITKTAGRLADLTFNLLANCQEKENRLAIQYGLTQAEFRCLRLFNAEETLNNKHIAERMNLSPSRLTRIIDGLVNKGYMSREIEPHDRRNMRVALSEKGVEIVKRLNDAYLGIHKEILSEIEEEQHSPLISAMTQLLSALEKWIART